MDVEILRLFGKIAGIGGLCLGVSLLIFRDTIRDILRARIFPRLTQEQAFKLFRLILILVWSVCIIGVVLWMVTPPTPPPPEWIRITRLELLDESPYTKRADRIVLTELKKRGNTEYHYSKPKDLRIALLFTCEGYEVRGDLQIEIRGSIMLKSLGGVKIAETSINPRWNVRDWRTRPGLEVVGPGNLSAFLGLPPVDSQSTPIPFIGILYDFTEKEAPRGQVEVVVTLTDGISRKTTSKSITISVTKGK